MSPPPTVSMTVDNFLPWAETQKGRWELIDGVPIAMSPERIINGQVKFLSARAFERAIDRAGVPCRSLLSSAAVRIGTHCCHQPDVLAYGGEALPDDAIEVPNPVVVVEVLSPSNAMIVLRDKLVGYFQVPSIAHYLVIDPDERLIIHHARGRDAIATRILNNGSLIRLDPPGLEMAVAEFFPPA